MELSDQKPQEPSLAIHFQLLEIWERLLEKRPGGIDESFFETGGDSLLLARMMEEVERVTGKYVSIVRFLECPTIRHLAESLVAEISSDDEVVLIQRGNSSRTPLFYFHGDVLGGGFYARKLAQQMGKDQPVFAVAPIELPEGELPTVDEIASLRVELIRKHRPKGPYILGGFCIGALTAYEVARRLADAGEVVKGVILINPHLAGTVIRSHRRLVEKMARRRGDDVWAAVETFMRGFQKLERFRDLWDSPWKEKAEFLTRNSRKLLRRSEAVASVPGGAGEHMEEAPASEEDPRLSAFQWIAAEHLPKPYDGAVFVLLTEDQERAAPYLVRKWRSVAPQVEVQYIPGQHLTCITTFGPLLADKMRLQLNKLNSFAET